jgi:hypothetical protein
MYNHNQEDGQTTQTKEDTMEKLSILVHNKQGASEGTVGTKKEINAWLRGWSDSENLSAVVTDENGDVVAEKPRGRKTIKW